MHFSDLSSAGLAAALATSAPVAPVDTFVASNEIRRLDVGVDIDQLRSAALGLLSDEHDQGNGFHTLNVTQRPGSVAPTVEDLSGRYYMRDEHYVEQAHDPEVDETLYTELHPLVRDTYVAEVVEIMRSVAPIGRVRLLAKDPYNCNSWHRDPEPRLHIPIVASPGSLFIVNNHVTHLPADGSIYFTDTRGYHTALNGGPGSRLSLVAAIAVPPVPDTTTSSENPS